MARVTTKRDSKVVLCDPAPGSPSIELIPGGKPYFSIHDDDGFFASITDKRSMRKLRDLLTETLDGKHTENI